MKQRGAYNFSCFIFISGFGDIFGNLWLGLEQLHQLTKNGDSTLRIELKRNDGASGYAEYTGFKVRSEAYDYDLDFQTFSGNIGDSLLVSVFEKFSTPDRDNDASASNCAATWKGGWWYYDCFEANLNNMYCNGTAENTNDTCMNWKAWSGNYGDIVYSEMKLRKAG